MRGFVIRVRLLRPGYQVTIGPDAIMPAHVHRGRCDWIARWSEYRLKSCPVCGRIFWLCLFFFRSKRVARFDLVWGSALSSDLTQVS